MSDISILDKTGKKIICFKSFNSNDLNYSIGIFNTTFLLYDNEYHIQFEADLSGYLNDFLLVLDRLPKLINNEIKELLWYINDDESYRMILKKENNYIISIILIISLDTTHQFKFETKEEYIILFLEQLKYISNKYTNI